MVDLFVDYYDFAIECAMKLTKNKYRSEDLVQEMYFKIAKSNNVFKKEERNIKGYIYRSIYNIFLSSIKDNKKYCEDINNETERIKCYQKDKGYSDEILKVFSKIKEKYKTVFLLIAVDGYKLKEVAEQKGYSYGRTRYIYTTARRTLEQLILKQEIKYRFVLKKRKTTMKDISLKDLQVNLPWTVKYSEDFRKNPQSHKDFSHALVHTIKACGKISELIDNLDHRRELPNPIEVDKYIADLVICALRMSNTYPGSMIDLQESVIKRLETKNNIKLFLSSKLFKKEDARKAIFITGQLYVFHLYNGSNIIGYLNDMHVLIYYSNPVTKETNTLSFPEKIEHGILSYTIIDSIQDGIEYINELNDKKEKNSIHGKEIKDTFKKLNKEDIKWKIIDDNFRPINSLIKGIDYLFKFDDGIVLYGCYGLDDFMYYFKNDEPFRFHLKDTIEFAEITDENRHLDYNYKNNIRSHTNDIKSKWITIDDKFSLKEHCDYLIKLTNGSIFKGFFEEKIGWFVYAADGRSLLIDSSTMNINKDDVKFFMEIPK